MIDTGAHADGVGAIGADVILVGAVLATLSRDPLQLLLRRRIGVSDLHLLSIDAELETIEVLDDPLTYLPTLEAGGMLAGRL